MAVGLPSTPRPLRSSPPHPTGPAQDAEPVAPPRLSEDSTGSSVSTVDSDASSRSYEAFSLEQQAAAIPAPVLAPPVPPQLSITTSTTPTRIANPNPDALPTYNELASQEPGNQRFGRWRGWVDKRARERREDLEIARAEGRVPARTSWNLHDAPETDEFEGVQESRARDANAERRISREPYRVSVTNPDRDEREQDSPAPSSASSGVKGGHGVVPLTASTAIHPLGSRFLRQISEKPRCGAVLPVGLGKQGTGQGRFVLVGTSQGLYLTDLVPSLGAVPLRTASSASDAVVLPVWTGLGVLQLEVYVEKELPSSKRPADSPRGVVFALVNTPGDPDSAATMRMWSLTSLVNLAKWRCFNESSEPVVMPPLNPPVAPRATSDGGKRTSKAFFKSLFTGDPASASSGSTSRSQSATTVGKGKARAVPPPASRGQPLEPGFFVVESTRLPSQQHEPRTTTDSSRRSCDSRESLADSLASRARRTSDASSQPMDRSGSVSSEASLLGSCSSLGTPVDWTSNRPEATTNSLPFEWANSSVAMPLPRGHSPIHFFHLSGVPARDPDSSATGDADTLKNWDDQTLFLAVATSRVIYVFTSRPNEKRTWVMSNEFYAPATPRFVTFVQTDPSLVETPRSIKRSSNTPASPVAHTSLGNLCIFLGTRRESVLIRLSDLSVREIDISPSARHGRVTSRGSVNSARSVMASVASLVESRHGIPAGVRGEERNIAVGRRIAESSGHGDVGDEVQEDWIGCDELVIPTRALNRQRPGELSRRLYLLSKGMTTSVVLSPLGAQRPGLASEAPLPHPGGGPPPIHLRPIHTFIWPSPVVKVVALLPPRTLKPDVDPTRVHFILVGFTRTGVHLQEGMISTRSVEDLFHPNQSSNGALPLQAFFTPTRSHSISPLVSEPTPASVDAELGDTASFDFSRASGLLCLGDAGCVAPPAPAASSPAGDSSDSDDDDSDAPKVVQVKRPRGLFFWTAAHSDFQLKWLG